MDSKTNNLPMAILKPFGPSIIKVKLPEVIVSRLNDYVDNLLKDEQKLKALDHGAHLAGNVSQEFLLENDVMENLNWGRFIAAVCSEWLKRTNGRELKDLMIIKSWIVRQFKNEYNPVHHHSGHISGVGYLKVPQHMGASFQKGKAKNRNGNLVFIHGAANVFSNATYEIEPEVGDFYMFPNYLQHAVYPFNNTEEERRSISFNAVIDAEAASY